VATKKKKPAIELPPRPKEYYDNATNPYGQKPKDKDRIKANNSFGSRAIYRKRGYDYWTGV
jgi:hypothetical protein